MIKVWYRHQGQRPRKTDMIREGANKANRLPRSFEVIGVQYGRSLDDGSFDSNQFALRVDPPSDNISTNAVGAIATAFEDSWGGTVEHVEAVQS
jgi:hypothetical protein